MFPERVWVLLGRKKSGDITPEEADELQSLLAGAEGGRFAEGGRYSDGGSYAEGGSYANEVLDKVWESSLQAVPAIHMNKSSWNNIQKKINSGERKPSVLHSITWRKALVAASLLVVVASAAILYMVKSARRPATPMMNQVATQTGSKTRLELPDGTQVWLNGNSQLTYGSSRFGIDEREVTLNGEAFFDVVKNEKVPFVLHTGNIIITVKGTAFNVRAYPKEKTIETALIRGLVWITTTKDPDRKIILKPNEKIIMPVDNSLEEQPKEATPAVSPSSLYSIVKLQKDSSQAIPETVWMKPKLEFDNEPFETLAPKMENWFNVKIHFGNDAIKKRRFSAVIEKETLTETLDAMRISGRFSYQIKGNELWIREN
jgi:transmembrane sensor